nr:DUF3817 domain-containing protein [uncultured Novosphingobium sp.]
MQGPEPPTIVAAAEDGALIRRLRLTSFIEASTLLILLFIAVPLKHVLGYPEATRIMGPIHGAAFVAYAWTVVVVATGGGDWSRGEIARLVAAAFVPFGGFANVGLLRRKAAAVPRRSVES